jgi:hypothetical protein
MCPSLRRVEAEDGEFEASLNYIVRVSEKNTG